MNNRILAVILIAVGVCLLIYGMQASQSLGSDLSRFFTGSPTDRTIWLIVGGLAALIGGLVLFLRGAKR